MPKVLLSFGSNIAPKKSTLQMAMAEIVKRNIGKILMISPYYKSEAIGKTDQDWFVNCCALIETSFSPLTFLEALQKIETDYGRIRGEKWGARTLDIDILLFEMTEQQTQEFKNNPTLTIPHPEIKNRLFVLRPLYDLMPWLAIDGVPLIEYMSKNADQLVKPIENKKDIYEESIDMYWNISPRDINMNLDNIKMALESIGNPHLKMPPVIHVAGTNGKGSTSAILHNLLGSIGKKVHRYTSPHLLSYCERFIFGLENGARRFVSIEEFEIMVSRTAPLVKRYKLSHFEALTLMAFIFFSETPADYVILETGMGGRKDATNLIPNPIATIITSISRDHTEYLGDMIEAIAFEKAGIIKQNVPVIVSARFPDAVKVIEQQAHKMNAPLLRINHEWSIETIEDEKIETFVMNDEEIFLDVLSLQGTHQLDNAGAALSAFISIVGGDNLPDPEIIDEALATVHWPARLEHLTSDICNLPLTDNIEFIVDGAHNIEGLYALIDYLNHIKQINPKKLVLLVSFKKGKNLDEVFNVLSSLNAEIVFIKNNLADNQYAVDDMIPYAEAYNIDYQVAESWQYIVSIFQDRTDTLQKRYVVCGSLYFVGIFYEMISYKLIP